MISGGLHPLWIYCTCTNDEGEILLCCAACAKRAFVSAGPKGEGGLDDATGASKSAGGGASMKQTSNTVNLGEKSSLCTHILSCLCAEDCARLVFRYVDLEWIVGIAVVLQKSKLSYCQAVPIERVVRGACSARQVTFKFFHKCDDYVGKVKRGDEGDAFGMGFKFPWQKKKEESQ